MNNKFDKSKETLNELREFIAINNCCLMIRPTGFGKTYNLVEIASDFDDVLYFYPRDIIRTSTLEKYKTKTYNINFVSYQYLCVLFREKSINILFDGLSDNTLLIFDEAHMMGGPMTSRAIDWILTNYKYKYIGATATPYRSDNFDIIEHFFHHNVLSQYTIASAIKDGVFQKAKYVFNTYELDERLEEIEEYIRNSNSTEKNELLYELNSQKVKLYKLNNMPDILKKHLIEDNYYKVMIFYPDIDILGRKSETVIGWFKKAFPDYEITETTIVSRSPYRKNLKTLGDLKRKPNHIDIIQSIDMLNFGYHIEDLNVVVMLRCTNSDIIYKQQIGRIFNVASSNKPVVFDLVGNHVKQNLFNMEFDNRKTRRKKIINTNFDQYMVEASDNMKEIDQIFRAITDRVITTDVINKMVCDAYLNKNAPLKWCLFRTNTRSVEDFQSLLKAITNRDLNEIDKNELVVS